MLDYYEIETGNFKDERSFFNPRKLFVELKEIFSPMINSDKLKLYFLINENTPDLINHDLKRIKQVLVNFMSNSVKYTKKGIIS